MRGQEEKLQDNELIETGEANKVTILSSIKLIDPNKIYAVKRTRNDLMAFANRVNQVKQDIQD